MTAADIEVEELRAGQIDARPRHFDVGIGYPDEWNYVDVDECYECGTLVVGYGFAECPSCGIEMRLEGPMMNYIYPLQERDGQGVDEQRAAERIADLPLCLVHVHEEGRWFLALTGGGMDLTWEIAEAYILLGLLPPLHFCDLPGMAGRGTSARDRTIIRACLRTIEVAEFRTSWKAEKLQSYLKDGA